MQDGLQNEWFQSEQVAIGVQTRHIDLVYWLGSISPDVIQSISETREMIRHVVPLRPLDDYINHTLGKRLLIKIDAEGLELEVLRGASRILTENPP